MLVLDIETYFYQDSDPAYFAYKSGNITAPSTYKNPDKILSYIEGKKKAMAEKAALDPRLSNIILVGMLCNENLTDSFSYNENSKIYERFIGLPPAPNPDINEVRLLSETIITIHKALTRGHKLITYNGKKFDLPFIFKRLLIRQIPPPATISILNLMNKYNNESHVDLFSILEEGSLSEWAYLLGQSLELGGDTGNDIANYMEIHEYDKIITKNKSDVYRTLSIYEAIKGWL